MFLLTKHVWTLEHEDTIVMGLYDEAETAKSTLNQIGLSPDARGVYFETYKEDCIVSYEINEIMPNTTYPEGIVL